MDGWWQKKLNELKANWPGQTQTQKPQTNTTTWKNVTKVNYKVFLIVIDNDSNSNSNNIVNNQQQQHITNNNHTTSSTWWAEYMLLVLYKLLTEWFFVCVCCWCICSCLHSFQFKCKNMMHVVGRTTMHICMSVCVCVASMY